VIARAKDGASRLKIERAKAPGMFLIFEKMGA
jgi:hypothetical protein